MRKILLISVLSLIYGYSVAQNTAVETYGQLSVSGTNIVDSQGNPVQLQGMSMFWSNWSNQWGDEGDFYTAAAVAEINDKWCANIVRAAMGVEPTGAYLDDPQAQIAKVEVIVDAAIAEGMDVIIDWHAHDAYNNQDAAANFFVRMAKKYGDQPNVIYEIFNEPDCANDVCDDWATQIKPYSEVVIDSIRKYDPDNIIVVGTPKWSQDVDVASQNPIQGETNIAYTLHYYAATHGAWLRGKAETAMNNGLALFVTEYGTVEASGGGLVDETESNAWYAFMKQHNISHCNWSLHDKAEGASALKNGTSNQGNWTDDDLTVSGLFVKNYLVNNCPEYRSVASTDDKVKLNFDVYPNPASNMLYIEGVEANWKLFNTTGTLMSEGSGQQVNLNAVDPGLYILEVNGQRVKILKD